MDGHSGGYGAIACAETTKNPILVANAVLEKGPHPMLVGRAADDYAQELGHDCVANETFTTPLRQSHWHKHAEQFEADAPASNHISPVDLDTVGAVVYDVYGYLAAGGSAGEVTGKRGGRISDSAILGAGIYADASIAVAW